MSVPKIKVNQFIYGELTRPESWFKQYVEPINRMYCETWNYEYVLDIPEWMHTDRSGLWLKPESILRHLTDCDYLFYLDADARFYSHGLSIHDEILPLMQQAGEEKVMLFTNDCYAECWRWNATGVSAGILLVRNCEEAKQILHDWIGVPDMPEYRHLRFDWLQDQSGLQYHVHPKYPDKIHMEREYYMIQGRYSHFVRHICRAAGENRNDVFKAIFESPTMACNRMLKRRQESE